MSKLHEPCTAALKPEYYAYLLEHVHEQPGQKKLFSACETLDHAGMMASPDEYQFLGWLCETLGVKRVVEVGVFRGVSTLAIALRLPEDGIIRAMDVSRDSARIGMEAWKEMGVDKKIDFMEGPAKKSMQKLIDEGESGTYDFVFIDANKDEYPEYYELALQLIRKGGIIAVDNTLLHGIVTDPEKKSSPSIAAIIKLNDTIRTDTRVSAVMSTLADGVYFARKL